MALKEPMSLDERARIYLIEEGFDLTVGNITMTADEAKRRFADFARTVMEDAATYMRHTPECSSELGVHSICSCGFEEFVRALGRKP